MQIENENFILEFSENDKALAEQVANVLDTKYREIMKWFELKTLPKKTLIKIYDDREEYKKHLIPWLEKNGERWHDWMIADTYDGNINMLNIEKCREVDDHSDMDMQDFLTTPIHEFVHICHRAVLEDDFDTWFMEGLATQLAEQGYYTLSHIPYTAEQILGEFKELDHSYSVAYTLMGYMLEHNSHEQMLEYAKHPITVDLEQLIKDTNASLEQQAAQSIKA